METDPTQDTLPTPVVRARSPLMRFVRSAPGAFALLAAILGLVLSASMLGGYQAGLAQRDRVVATAQFLELKAQYDLGIEDMAAGRLLLAAQRFEYILSIDANFPGAATRLAEARAGLAVPTATPTQSPTSTPDPQTAQRYYAEAQQAFAAGDWDATIEKISGLRAADPTYEVGPVAKMLFTSLRNRGIAAINDGKLELGLADLDQAETIGALDEEALQYRQWASLYITGSAYWGLNWPRTIETYSLLYTIAPYFRDTISRLHDAHVKYGDALNAGGDPCGAALEYGEALKVTFSQVVEDKRLQAEMICAEGTPVPDGDGAVLPGVTATP